MLYHYTDRHSAADILKAGCIRARSITLHKDMLGRDHGFATKPLVWLTINPIIEGTVIAKMRIGGWQSPFVGDLWRFALPKDYAPFGLGEYSDQHKIADAWWEWTVRTGALAGSDYTTWRLHSRHIPAKDWCAVEVLSALDPRGTTSWTPHPLPSPDK